MAARQQLLALKTHPNLQRFLIENARPTGRQLGVGSYGSVEELEVNGVVCAGKKIHESLIERENLGAENIASKYVEECQLMSDLRHPHLVQFLGVCFLPDSTLPVLVMERLLTNLDDLLENSRDIPLPLKRSILADVARGLVYLHSHSPPVIHRDLSAKNVLLNSAMVAKISDLGNARIVNLQPGELARTLTRIPGTMVYMSPEAFDDTSKYGPSLDSFSFGHLSLFTITQVFPHTLLQPTYRDPVNPKALLARSEVQRRDEYIKPFRQQLGEQHPLVVLVEECLDNEPSERPSAQELLQRLEGMKAQIRDPYQHLTKLDAVRMLREKDMDNQDLLTQLEYSSQLTAKDSQLTAKDATLNQEMGRLQLEHSSQLTASNSQLAARDAQLIAKNAEISRLGEDLKRLQADLEAREAQIQEMVAETERKEAEIQDQEPIYVDHFESGLDLPSKPEDVKERQTGDYSSFMASATASSATHTEPGGDNPVDLDEVLCGDFYSLTDQTTKKDDTAAEPEQTNLEPGDEVIDDDYVDVNQIKFRETQLQSTVQTCQHDREEDVYQYTVPETPIWLGEYQSQKVAMTMIKDCKAEKVIQKSLAEAAIMTTLQHPNFVRLMGVCQGELSVCFITEYMAMGSLRDYLMSRGRAGISQSDQLGFARDICRGMVYLESKNLVHRKLAARSVLLGEGNTAKISDFRLTREESFKTEHGEKLLVKWTAPEAIRENKFSKKSDVWSFGILLWEIYSYGRTPYPKLGVTEVLPHVEQGNRMGAPDSCTDGIYQIMKECWDKEASQRPNFVYIEGMLQFESISMA